MTHHTLPPAWLTQPQHYPPTSHNPTPVWPTPPHFKSFENSQMDMRGCVWVVESFLSHDKWKIKLLSDFFYKSYFTFYKWLKLKK